MYKFFITIIFILLYSIISIKYDLKYRKIPNKINLSFLIISLTYFAIENIYLKTNSNKIITLLIITIISFLLYQNKIWGGADGKIFIGICSIILILKHSTFILNYIINLCLIYSTISLIDVITKTNKKSLKKSLKKINFSLTYFSTILIFFLISKLYQIIQNKIGIAITKLPIIYENQIIIFFGLTFFTIIFLNKLLLTKTNIYYLKLKTTYKIILNTILTINFLYFSTKTKIIYFLIILILFYTNEFIYIELNNNKNHQKIKNKKLQILTSAFTVYLFICFFITIFLKKNIIIIIFNLI